MLDQSHPHEFKPENNNSVDAFETEIDERGYRSVVPVQTIGFSASIGFDP